ncbi:MAG: hypothetical protein KDM63_05975 [Verrucomicrobiae bacterium]|nr:hypothetical protein [Verrucomicrobiae bacterium]
MSQPSFRQIVCTLALVAVAGLQASGGTVLYLCECTGKLFLNVREHCHGESGADGSLNHEAAGHHHHDGDLPGHTRHQHTAVEESVPGVVPTLVVAPEVRLLPVFGIDLPVFVAVPSDEDFGKANPPRDDGGGPPLTSLLVTRSVVRLI